jgi:hypothetical protein
MPRHPYTRGGEAPDPQRYVLVKTKEGSYYRLRRGLGKPARLNCAFQQSADRMKLSSPAAQRLKCCLAEALRGLQAGRLIARLGARLKEALQRDGRFHFGCFAGYDFQREHPLDRLLLSAYRVTTAGGEARLSVPLYRGAVRQKSAQVSHYYFELVLVWGDAGRDGGLRRDSVSSPLYSFGVDTAPHCELSLALPGCGAPWMLLLKTSCLEGNELAHHPRHYGMRVVAVG